MGANLKKHRSKGFTLIEVMIVVMVISILSAIAYASYQRNVIESRRKAATGCLMEVGQFMERYYTTNLTYVNAATPGLQCRTDLAAFYTIGVGTPTATGYALTATPVGQQALKDTRCGTLGLTQTGAKTETGTGTVVDCW